MHAPSIRTLYSISFVNRLRPHNARANAEISLIRPTIKLGKTAALSAINRAIAAASEIHVYGEDEWAVGTAKKSKKDKKKKKKGQLSKPRLRNHDRDVNTARLVVNTLVYALADKYEIDDLKAQAKQKFEEAVVQDWDSQAFAYAAELVFSTTPNSDRGLRTVVTKTINMHRELVNYEEVQRLLDSGNGMAWALIQVLLGDHIDD
ncbi:hypothetical protein LTR05_008774 [Lithohypha guttulata]|uniref:Uncharacterized protein n=1 Tax=Lithohypha guttulata TaxID=1690604 RepID=A0AAN7QC97_9EURO|nr:hypothetical protein LTR05_008774 [Lithohypha guttulata]